VSKGWIALFDKQTLFGWRAESEADWRVEDGCICVSAGEPGLLRTTSQFDNFDLRVEFAAGDATNSGVFLRTSPVPSDPARDCYEVNVAPPENPFPTASIVARQRVQAGEELRSGLDAFHLLEITCDRGAVFVSLDGNAVIEYQDDRPLGRGYIGLQLNRGPVRFRNIWLRPRYPAPESIQDPASWVLGGDVRTERNRDGSLRLTSGPGYLESVGQWADFVMQAKCKIGPDQNSGIFFRCIPGENQDGYESQIDNRWNGERTRPLNAGTGAIFRRTEARRVVADDNQWFAKTIAVCGPHVSIWVNGYQVTDWSDQRPADPNPRRGRRLDSGTVMIQAHDAGTDLSIDEIRIMELAPRKRN
jgi:hypothetical protein